MIIKNEKPPIWNDACAAFRVNPKNTVFTYGDIVYNPSGQVVSEDVLVHEAVHGDQQQHNSEAAALWWGRYLRDDGFRVDQEARAYGKQLAFLYTKFKDRNRRVRILFDLARVLSGPLYGSSTSHADAILLIKKHAGIA